MQQYKFLIYKWQFFEWTFIKMVSLTLETNTFCSRRKHVQMKRSFVCNNYQQRFPGKKLLQYLLILILKERLFLSLLLNLIGFLILQNFPDSY